MEIISLKNKKNTFVPFLPKLSETFAHTDSVERNLQKLPKNRKKIHSFLFSPKLSEMFALTDSVERNSRKNRKKILRRNFGQKWAKWPA